MSLSQTSCPFSLTVSWKYYTTKAFLPQQNPDCERTDRMNADPPIRAVIKKLRRDYSGRQPEANLQANPDPLVDLNLPAKKRA